MVKEDRNTQLYLDDLRKQAEGRIRQEKANLSALSDDETAHLIHELRAHQIELEMQNDELRQTQFELSRARDKYLDLYDFAPIGYFTISEKGIIIEANHTLAKMLGTERSLLINKPFRNFVCASSQDAFYFFINRLLAGENPRSIELKNKHDKGIEFDARLDVIKVEAPESKSPQFRFSLVDITESIKKAAAILQESEDQYRKLYNGMPVMMMSINQKEEIVSVNDHWLNTLGYTHKEVIGTSPTRYMTEESITKHEKFFPMLFQKGEINDIELQAIHKNGTLIDVSTSSKVDFDEDGTPGNTFTYLIDITAQKQAEKAQLESKERYRRIVETAEEGIWLVNDKWETEFVNARMAEMLGYAPEEMVGKHLFSFMDKREQSRAQDLMNQREQGINEKHDFKFQRRDGTDLWSIVSTNAITNDDGKFMHALAMVTDITKRKRAEDTLKKTEEHLRLITDNIPALVSHVDRDLNCLFANKSYLAYCGVHPGELIGKKISEVLDKEAFARAHPHIQKALNGEFVNLENHLTREDGHDLDFQVSYIPHFEANEVVGYFVLAWDITERKLAKEELQKKTYDLGERNKELECLYGISEILERSDISLNEILDGIVNSLHKAWQFPEVAHSRIIFDDGEEILCRHGRLPVEERWSLSSEIKVANKRVGVITVFYAEEKPQADEGVFQKEERLLLNVIAERLGKIIKNKQVEDQIRTSLQEKETLLREIHHRVKNNMNVVSSLLSLHKNSTQNKDVKKALQESQGRIYAMSAVHESLYNTKNMAEIDLIPYLNKLSTSLIQTYLVNPGKVRLIVDGDDIKVNLDKASPLGLTINELISNALKYAFPDERKGNIEVTTTKQGDQLELTIKDDGVGMPDGLDWKKSSTLGLKLVRNLIENQLNGSIDANTQEGTQFTIKINLDA